MSSQAFVDLIADSQSASRYEPSPQVQREGIEEYEQVLSALNSTVPPAVIIDHGHMSRFTLPHLAGVTSYL